MAVPMWKEARLHLTEKRTFMSEKTLNARLNSNRMKKHDNFAYKLGQAAYRLHMNYLEDKCKKDDEEENK